MHKNVIIIGAADTITRAVSLAKRHGVSQFPVIEKKAIVGSLTTRDIIGAPKNSQVSVYMTEPFPTINADTPLHVVKSLLKHQSAVLVLKNSAIEGIITAEDLL